MSLIIRKQKNSDAVDSPLSELQRGVDEIFGRLFRGFDIAPFSNYQTLETYSLTPKIDVSESTEGYHVSAELPGVDEKDLDVSVNKGVLTIKGEKKLKSEEKKKNFHRVERSYGSFERSLALPQDVDQENIKANFNKGVLEVDLVKKPSSIEKAKKIEVKSS